MNKHSLCVKHVIADPDPNVLCANHRTARTCVGLMAERVRLGLPFVVCPRHAPVVYAARAAKHRRVA